MIAPSPGGRVTDPAGNVIETTYDAGGRVVSRKATAIIGGFDTTVHEIVTAYNSRGMVESVHQENTGNTVLDEVAYEYDGFGNLWTRTQDPDSAIGGAGRDEFVTTNTYALYTCGCQKPHQFPGISGHAALR